MIPSETIDHVREFVRLQRRLWQALRDEHPEPLAPGLVSFPKRGEVMIDNGTWTFTRHGAGILFSEESGARKIDLHDAFAGPDLIDVWRLATYFGSLGARGESLVRRAVGTSGTLSDRLRSLLERLESQGVLRNSLGAYEFTDGQSRDRH